MRGEEQQRHLISGGKLKHGCDSSGKCDSSLFKPSPVSNNRNEGNYSSFAWILIYIVILYKIFYIFQESKLKEVQKSNLKKLLISNIFFLQLVSFLLICRDEEFNHRRIRKISLNKISEEKQEERKS